jgi:hypothetical protein
MVYPNNQAGRANAVTLDPALHAGLLNGLGNLAQAITALDQVHGPQADTYVLLTAGWKPIAGVWAWTVAGRPFNGSLLNVSAADGDAIEIELRVPSTGTYTLNLATYTDNDAPIVRLFLDEVSIGVVGGYDLYSAPPVPGAVLAVAALALTAGYHKLKILVDGLNVLSTDYLVRLAALSLQRTA